jgi:hypothetical protein
VLDKLQELRKTMQMLQHDQGAVVKDAQKKLAEAKKAQGEARKVHSTRDQALQDKIAERESAEAQRAELQEQLAIVSSEAIEDSVRFDSFC